MASFSAEERRNLAKQGKAMPDGSFPIRNTSDLKNAIRAVGRGNANHNAIRKFIMRRARALGAMDMIPDDWTNSGSSKGSM